MLVSYVAQMQCVYACACNRQLPLTESQKLTFRDAFRLTLTHDETLFQLDAVIANSFENVVCCIASRYHARGNAQGAKERQLKFGGSE